MAGSWRSAAWWFRKRTPWRPWYKGWRKRKQDLRRTASENRYCKSSLQKSRSACFWWGYICAWYRDREGSHESCRQPSRKQDHHHDRAQTFDHRELWWSLQDRRRKGWKDQGFLNWVLHCNFLDANIHHKSKQKSSAKGMPIPGREVPSAWSLTVTDVLWI